MTLVFAIVIGILTSGLSVAGAVFLKKQLASSAGTETEAIQLEINEVTKKLEELAGFAKGYASKKQLDNVEAQLQTERNNLSREKEKLKEVEAKLEGAQKSVETKEGQQQETKSAKEEDEQKLRELMAAYADISSESMALEKKLAASLKNLEVIITEVKMTDNQKAVLNDMLTALTDGSSRLRELLTEYQIVNERLNMLTGQHSELEEEYTKLVEQQLGE